ncbi:hypothetical protein BDW72DRAFT_177818 [Aspergillus terricola var. indicus]
MGEKRQIPEHLYHILFTTSHIHNNPNNVVEKVRVPGTYTSLSAAKAAAHSCLYDAGYEQEWFETYEGRANPTDKETSVSRLADEGGLMVYAKAPDGTIFRVRIRNTPNDAGLTSDLPDGRVSVPLYYVLQASVEYSDDEGSLMRDIDVQYTSTSYEKAREFASTVLFSPADGITKDSFAEYNEAGPNETDCGYGENVIVHAVSDYGTNYLVSVVKTQELEAVSIAEAAMRIL